MIMAFHSYEKKEFKFKNSLHLVVKRCPASSGAIIQDRRTIFSRGVLWPSRNAGNEFPPAQQSKPARNDWVTMVNIPHLNIGQKQPHKNFYLLFFFLYFDIFFSFIILFLFILFRSSFILFRLFSFIYFFLSVETFWQNPQIQHFLTNQSDSRLWLWKCLEYH